VSGPQKFIGLPQQLFISALEEALITSESPRLLYGSGLLRTEEE
jgi:hypothetical protein